MSQKNKLILPLIRSSKVEIYYVHLNRKESSIRIRFSCKMIQILTDIINGSIFPSEMQSQRRNIPSKSQTMYIFYYLEKIILSL